MRDESAAENSNPHPVRVCPTPRGELPRLIVHTIGVPICLERQREYYHKCHRCQYRGQSAHFVPDQAAGGLEAAAG